MFCIIKNKETKHT